MNAYQVLQKQYMNASQALQKLQELQTKPNAAKAREDAEDIIMQLLKTFGYANVAREWSVIICNEQNALKP